jgi:hypothetical protein
MMDRSALRAKGFGCHDANLVVEGCTQERDAEAIGK